MFDTLAWALFAAAATVLAAPVLWAWRLVGLYRHRPAPPVPFVPQATVILPLRGADPSLPACLAGLLDQDYPSYEVRIIIDSRADPAWAAVEAALARGTPANVAVHVAALGRARPTCGLKVSAQLQAVAGLADSCAVVALIDADVVPGRAWLRSLVAPLAEPGVGAASGVRWFAPADGGWGSLVRHLWNAGAFAQMCAFGIPWGGSLAFRTGVLRRAGLLEAWGRCLCEDTVSYGVLRRAGLAVRFAPAATTINREPTDLAGACTFVRRQLVCARLHHARWGAVAALNLGTGLALAAVAALGGARGWAAAAAGLLGAYALGLLAALAALEALVRRRARERGEAPPPPPFSWKTLPALALAQAVHLGCLLSALGLRRVTWRGVTYRLGGRGQVRLLEYRPFAAAPAAAESVL
jgi:cellulose synthase/poly-beta-1,6-N-acetylglucosamine synthase-like glycosyltransferase